MSIEKALTKLVAREKIDQATAMEIMGRIAFTDDLGAVAKADLFIESIIEDIDTKKAKFAEVDRIMKPDGILASNTSTLSITRMQEATGRHERFIGLHFFNPATAMKLVEVVPTKTTDPSVTSVAIGFVERLGKTPVLVADSTGFIVNRLLTPYMIDAMRCLEAGLADVHGIDTAMQLGANHPMGPLALADYIGLDIVHAMATNLYESFGEDYMKPTATLEKLVHEGVLGRKTKLGFYDYSEKPPVPNPALHG
jgi:3-hydroxybutyryl-CoA dehydrogenase